MMSTYPGGRGSSALALQFKHQSHPKAPSQKHPESCLIEHAWPRQIDTENESRARLASVPSTWRPPHLAGSGPAAGSRELAPADLTPAHSSCTGVSLLPTCPAPLPLVMGAEKLGRFLWGPELGRERLGLTSAPLRLPPVSTRCALGAFIDSGWFVCTASSRPRVPSQRRQGGTLFFLFFLFVSSARSRAWYMLVFDKFLSKQNKRNCTWII